jgi:hypothetical protein
MFWEYTVQGSVYTLRECNALQVSEVILRTLKQTNTGVELWCGLELLGGKGHAVAASGLEDVGGTTSSETKAD